MLRNGLYNTVDEISRFGIELLVKDKTCKALAGIDFSQLKLYPSSVTLVRVKSKSLAASSLYSLVTSESMKCEIHAGYGFQISSYRE
jgi:hypothetical protein